MKKLVHEYLEFLDIVLDNIPRNDMVCRSEVIFTSYSLLHSKNILVEIQYIDYLICYMFESEYINDNMFLKFGNILEQMIHGLKTKN